MTEQASQAWLTQAAYDRLSAELDDLKGPQRTEIARRIELAREEGDLKENAGYHAAREEQGKQEARIRQLTQLLRNAKVGEAPEDTGVVSQGMIVEANVGGRDMTFLVGSRESSGDDLKVFSEQSPLGAAIVGRSVGDSASYEAPNGATVKVVIKSATPYTG